MSLKTNVKAGNITNLSDARYCAGMGVEWLGFPADKVSPVLFKEITDWVTGPKFVLEADTLSSPEILSDYPVSLVEIGYEKLEWITLFPGREWVVKFKLSEWHHLRNKLTAHRNSNIILIVELNESPDKDWLTKLNQEFPVLVEFDESKFSLNEVLNLPVTGIQISGSQELKPGLKNFDSLASVLEELEILD